MRFGVVSVAGDPVAAELARSVEHILGSAGGTALVATDAAHLRDVDAAIVCGDPGAAIMAVVAQLASDGRPVLGVGDGFRALCQAGLLDGAVGACAGEQELAPSMHCVVEGVPTPFTHAIPAGRHVELTTGGQSGRYTHPDVESLEAEGRVVLRYCTFDGEVCAEANPAGSVNNIAGVCSPAANVLGMTAHPDATMLQSALAHHTGVPARVGG